MIVIEQAKINAPDFPRDLEWWRRFVPEWADVTVNEDGTVTVTGRNVHLQYTAERGSWFGPNEKWTAADARRHERTVDSWVRRQPRLAVAIREEGTA
jgi:hypothetical protein